MGDFKLGISLKDLHQGNSYVSNKIRYVYFGQENDGKAESQGILVNSYGFVKMGTWHNDQLHGQGRSLYDKCIQGNYQQGRIIGSTHSYTYRI